MKTDAARPTALAVAGLGITYQATLIDGKTLAFETAIDNTVDRPELDGFLDTFIGAAKRQQAIEELPLVKQSLSANTQTLHEQERARARAVADGQARISASNASRRNPRPETPASDVAALAQFDQRISQLKSAIAAARARIPYLEAIIDRREPPEMFPVAAPGIDDEIAA
jgi:hypothetical protein